MFFNREAFGRDALMVGEPPSANADESTLRLSHARPIAEFIAGFPISDVGKSQLNALYEGTRDPLAGKSIEEKLAVLKSTSYRNFLIKICGCGEDVSNCFQGRPLGYFGRGADAVPAADVRDHGYPGFAGLKLPRGSEAWSEPYIYHFPNGNASI